MALFGAVGGPAGPDRDLGRRAPVGAGARGPAGGARRFELVVVPPEPSGAARPRRGSSTRPCPGTRLVSVMTANNEYGGVFPVAEIADGVRRRGALFHTDAVQAAGRLPVEARAWGVDLLSVSAHKLHGPKGAGALFVRRGVALEAHTPGGGQEKRLRAGTENTLAIVGFGAAARLAAGERGATTRRRSPGAATRSSAASSSAFPARASSGPGSRACPTPRRALRRRSGEALLIRLDLEGVAVVGRKRVLERDARAVAGPPCARTLARTTRAASSASRSPATRPTREIARVLEILPGIVADVRGGGRPRRAASLAEAGA